MKSRKMRRKSEELDIELHDRIYSRCSEVCYRERLAGYEAGRRDDRLRDDPRAVPGLRGPVHTFGGQSGTRRGRL